MPMRDFTKPEKKQLRALSSEAYRRELREHLRRLDSSLAAGAVSGWMSLKKTSGIISRRLTKRGARRSSDEKGREYATGALRALLVEYAGGSRELVTKSDTVD